MRVIIQQIFIIAIVVIVGAYVFCRDQFMEFAGKVGVAEFIPDSSKRHVDNCEVAFRMIGMMITTHADSNDGKLPASLEDIDGFNADEFVCDNADEFDHQYFGKAFGNLEIYRIPAPNTVPIMMENIANKDKIVILFADGHTEVVEVNGRSAKEIITDICQNGDLAQYIILKEGL